MGEAIRFEAPGLVDELETAAPALLHALPFGVIKLDSEQRVVFFSETEARQSGWGPRPTRDLHFFAQVAPCMDSSEFRGRIERAAREGKLDIEIGHTGDLTDSDRFIRCRIMSSHDAGFWIALQRDLS